MMPILDQVSINHFFTTIAAVDTIQLRDCEHNKRNYINQYIEKRNLTKEQVIHITSDHESTYECEDCCDNILIEG